MSEGKDILVKVGIDRGTVDAARALESDKYAEGFVTDIEQDFAPKGLSADTVRFISAKKGEPDWMLQWRLEAYERWLAMDEPDWAKVDYPKIDYQDAYYYAAPKTKEGPKSLDEVDPKLLATYEKLGVPLHERARLAGEVVDHALVADAMHRRLERALRVVPQRQHRVVGGHGLAEVQVVAERHREQEPARRRLRRRRAQWRVSARRHCF